MKDIKKELGEIFEKYSQEFTENRKSSGLKGYTDNLRLFQSIINSYTDEIIVVSNRYMDNDSSLNKKELEKYLKDEILRFNSLLKVQ